MTTMKEPEWLAATLYTLSSSQINTSLLLAEPLFAPFFGGVDDDVIVCCLGPASSPPTAPKSPDRFSCVLLPTDGSAGAPLIIEAGLGWAKIACHVNSVDVLVERFEISLATPRCGLGCESLCRYHDIYFRIHGQFLFIDLCIAWVALEAVIY